MNTSFKKKYLYIALIFFSIPACAFAINILTEGYQVASTVTKIDAYGTCKNVNATDGKTYFIPTKSQGEWQSVVDHSPSGLQINSCAPVLLFTVMDGNRGECPREGSTDITPQCASAGGNYAEITGVTCIYITDNYRQDYDSSYFYSCYKSY